ncbi:MAG: DNA internalization-related competence protein ComEC/Rec2 [bacterium]|nr:DNA internalization-related competence protein ComEC/Rec2 [bacterium]
MGLLLAAAAAGLMLLPLLAWLPPPWLLAALALFFSLLWWRWRQHWLLCLVFFLAGFSWSVLQAGQALLQRIPPPWEGVELVAQGQVDGLSESAPHGLNFRFRPQTVQLDGTTVRVAGGRWQLFSPFPDVPLPDADCTLTVKLKRPHGVANPGGFDHEAWLLSENVTATGSVKSFSCKKPPRFSVDGLRLSLREEFQRVFPEQPAAGVLLALISGDRALIADTVWERYVATGVVHLMAISGLHITLLAMVTAWLVLHLLRLYPRLALRWPLHKPALLLGFMVACLYSLMAGFSVPTERTLIMLGVVLLAHLSERRLPAFQILALALIVVLLCSPLAVHAAGFWLSFGAVAILLTLGDPRRETPLWRQALLLQCVMSLLLLPLTLWFFERASWVSPLANLLAVPMVTFVIVPLGLLGLMCWLLSLVPLAHFFWNIATHLISVMDALLEQFQFWPAASVDWGLPSGWSFLCLLLALFCLLQPLQRSLRFLAPVFLLPLFFSAAAVAPDTLRLTVIDVGQGLSVLVETSRHQLLYDAGPTLGPRADAGRRYVLPLLHQRRVTSLDRLLLSHDDSDHTGGALSVLAGMPVWAGLGARPLSVQGQAATPWQDCRAGQHWQWDGWSFSVLYPSAEESLAADKDNNRSCVLMIRRGRAAVLLPGDLESRGESALLARMPASGLRASVLVLGHHGSRSASSADFLARVQPQWAIVSAGYRNQFHHPSPVLLQRLQDAGIPWRNTAASGAITMVLEADGSVVLEEFRRQLPRYWRTPPTQ